MRDISENNIYNILDPSIFPLFNIERPIRLAQRAAVMKDLFPSSETAAKAYYAYCQKEIDDSPEYINAYKCQPHQYSAGIASYLDLTSTAPQHSLSKTGDHDARFWSAYGFVYKPRFFSENLCQTLLGFLQDNITNYNVYKYSHISSLLSFYCSSRLSSLLRLITSVDPVLYMSIHGLKTTSRSWHQDEFFYGGYSHGSSFAVWIALDDVTSNMGAFCLLPGSHVLPILDKSKLDRFLADGMISSSSSSLESSLSLMSAAVTVPAYEAKVASFHSHPILYLPRRGDVLIWHSRLLHRACRASSNSVHRPAVIAHYCSLDEVSPAQRSRLKSYGNMFYAEE
tara:strand:- start:91 stop:1110 length:1020 start_codon:yes stop_codon:yes gene_type:complete